MAVDGAVAEDIVFLKYFRDLPDPWQIVKMVYPLDKILLLCLLAQRWITSQMGSA